MYRKFVGAMVAVTILPVILASSGEAGGGPTEPGCADGHGDLWQLERDGHLLAATEDQRRGAPRGVQDRGHPGQHRRPVRPVIRCHRTRHHQRCTQVRGAGGQQVRHGVRWIHPGACGWQVQADVVGSAGSSTIWKQLPLFSVVGGYTGINVAGGLVVGSFSPYLTPTATLAGAVGPWGLAAITAACGTSAGLSVLPLGVGSTGTW